MPCLDEASTVGECVTRAHAALARMGIAGEVVVADNGSTDGSREIAERAGARVVPVATRGYGSALAAGIRAALGRLLLIGDDGVTHDLRVIDPFVYLPRSGRCL